VRKSHTASSHVMDLATVFSHRAPLFTGDERPEASARHILRRKARSTHNDEIDSEILQGPHRVANHEDV
jgi:hypothetical protein